MNVLSLFDGMSCGQIALERAGIEYDNYFASEIDKWAIQITQKNYPDTIQLGDVKNWIEWDLPKIDLLIAGSPCQGFSRAGKGLNFDDPRSALFFDFVDILHDVKPKWWLLENVKMKQEWINIITQYLYGLYPIEINSALISAQSRKRLYWSNIEIQQPKDKGILLKDILHEKSNEYIKVSKTGQYKKFQDKASCLTGGAHSGGNHSDMDLIGFAIDIEGHDFLKRIYSKYGKSPTLTSVTGGNQHRKIAINNYKYRRLTPIECERLQTVPDNYTEGVSNTQRYKMLGNGWTVDVIAHIFKGIKNVQLARK
jgi:DNA-cytosine methyltransferase